MRTKNNHCPSTLRRKKKKQPKTEGCIGGGENLISKLPDDILIRVLSLLAPKEVIICGALSRRWTALPKLIPMTLKFVKKFEKPSLIEEAKFIHHVNEVLDSYPGGTLTELSISYYLSISMPDQQPLDICSQIDKWVQFAMANKVRKFNLDFGVSYLKYWFPPIYQIRLRSRNIGLPRCTSLTDLRLVSVNVTGEHIEHFLRCCPSLESLCVIRSNVLTSLKVNGPIRLEFLDIRDCYELQVCEVSAPNLISFKYRHHPVKSMPLKCAPQLKELLLSDYVFLMYNFPLFTSYFAQIETLSLDVQDYEALDFEWPIGIPTLRSLKHLTIRVSIVFNESLIGFGSWIEASPLLRRFVFEGSKLRGRAMRRTVEPRMLSHVHLKEVEFVGFVGDVFDTELATYIIEVAVNLRKIVFDCRDPDFENTEQTSLAIVCARKFQSMLSPAVEFVLIP